MKYSTKFAKKCRAHCVEYCRAFTKPSSWIDELKFSHIYEHIVYLFIDSSAEFGTLTYYSYDFCHVFWMNDSYEPVLLMSHTKEGLGRWAFPTVCNCVSWFDSRRWLDLWSCVSLSYVHVGVSIYSPFWHRWIAMWAKRRTKAVWRSRCHSQSSPSPREWFSLHLNLTCPIYNVLLQSMIHLKHISMHRHTDVHQWCLHDLSVWIKNVMKYCMRCSHSVFSSMLLCTERWYS